KCLRDLFRPVARILQTRAGATAADAEVLLSASLDAVPQAVGVIEGTGTGLQNSRDGAEQIAQALLQSGHGYVLQDSGLNTVQKLAARDGVAAATIFRDVDSADQTPSVIRRFLDQAAFRAAQEGGVIMLGRIRPDTISALLVWGLQDRATRVALAPVSAVLKQSQQ
ncbi:MAG: divergent polysaccharide deacetylase family protein, partial [Pseudomonadota bacterium]